MKECCAMSLMETWLNLYVPDDAVSMKELIILRLDRSSRVCIDINNNWCNSCSPGVELLTVKQRPCHLQRKFTVMVITAVPPHPQCQHQRSPEWPLPPHHWHGGGRGLQSGQYEKPVSSLPVVCGFCHKVRIRWTYTNIKEAFEAAPLPPPWLLRPSLCDANSCI